MKTNQHLQMLIQELKRQSIEQNVRIWKSVANDLSKSTRRQRIVNLMNLSKNTKENEIVVVPGKVLGVGDVSHKLTVAAWSFSQSASEKLVKIGAKMLTINDLMKENPKGSKVRILG